MNYTILVLVTIAVFAFPSALGIICNKCIPSQMPPKLCNLPNELEEVNCDNENGTVPGTNISITYDTCITSKIVANLGTTYVMECAAKNNVSDPSVVNCSTAEARICNDARARVASSGITINSCPGICCATNKCNVKDLFATPTSPTPPPSTTGPSSTAGTTTKSGVKQVQPTFLGFLLVFLTVVLKKVDELF